MSCAAWWSRSRHASLRARAEAGCEQCEASARGTRRTPRRRLAHRELTPGSSNARSRGGGRQTHTVTTELKGWTSRAETRPRRTRQHAIRQRSSPRTWRPRRPDWPPTPRSTVSLLVARDARRDVVYGPDGDRMCGFGEEEGALCELGREPACSRIRTLNVRSPQKRKRAERCGSQPQGAPTARAVMVVRFSGPGASR